jgi:hypothetical protein
LRKEATVGWEKESCVVRWQTVPYKTLVGVC